MNRLTELAMTNFRWCLRQYRYNAWGSASINPQTGAGVDGDLLPYKTIEKAVETAYLARMWDVFNLHANYLSGYNLMTKNYTQLIEWWIMLCGVYDKIGEYAPSENLRTMAYTTLKNMLDDIKTPIGLVYTMWNPTTRTPSYPSMTGREINSLVDGAIILKNRGDTTRLTQLKTVVKNFMANLAPCGLPWQVQSVTGVGSSPGYLYDYWVSGTLEGLIGMYQVTGDSDYLALARQLADTVINVWTPLGFKMHVYVDPEGGILTTAHSHGHIIVHDFAWLYRLTGDSEYLEWAEEVSDNALNRLFYDKLIPTTINIFTGAVGDVTGTFNPEYMQSLLTLYNITFDKKHVNRAEAFAKNYLKVSRSPYGIPRMNVFALTKGDSQDRYIFGESFKYLLLMDNEFNYARKDMWTTTFGTVMGL